MSASRFIAHKLSYGGKDDRLGRISNVIAWVSVALSVAIMIVAVVVVCGFKYEIRSKATGFMGSVVLTVPGQTPLNDGFPVKDSLSYKDELLKVKDVGSVDGVAYCSGIVKTDDNIQGIHFKGVDSLYNMEFFSKVLCEGRLPDFSGRIGNDILISKRLSSQLDIKVGDEMVCYFVSKEVKARKFIVCGLFDAQLEEIDRLFALVDIRHVRKLNGWDKGDVSSIEIKVDPLADIGKISDDVEAVTFMSSGDSDPSLFVTPVTSIYGYLFDWLALLDLNVLMILALMMVVAGFNMISAILIILFRKISMIGLLKALGMTNSQVRNVFIRRAAAIVGKGMLWGNVIGLSIALVQKYFRIMKLDPANYFVSYVPVDINAGYLILLNVVCAIVIMSILSLSTGFISKVSPDRTMRVE